MKFTYLHDFLLQNVERLENKTAITNHQHKLSYRELKELTDKYALILKESGIRKGDRVILELHTTPYAIAMMMAVSYTSAVFVFVSPQQAEERKKTIIDLAEPSFLITDNVRTSTDKDITMLLLENERLQLVMHGTGRALLSDQPEDLVYIVFTSGSTGIPKGIMMTHGAVLSFYEGLENLSTPESAVVGSIAPLQFDFSLIDIGVALASGATLVQVPSLLVHYPKRFVQFHNTYKISQQQGVPSIWQEIVSESPELLKELTFLRRIIFGGENFPVKHLEAIAEALPCLEFVQLFGHSESIACSYKSMKAPLPLYKNKTPLGKGFYNVRMSLKDSYGQEITEPDIIGEVYLEGECLFSGYLKNKEETERVLLNSIDTLLDNRKIFKSGDLAFKDEQGEFYFISRNDNQVKIMGNRVELQEIENVLFQYEKVLNASVLFNNQIIPHQLVAFVWMKDVDLEGLKNFCSDRLPHYMLPQKYILKQGFDTTLNGKIDRNKLLALL